METVLTEYDKLVESALTQMNSIIFGLSFLILLTGMIIRISTSRRAESQFRTILLAFFVVLAMVSLPYAFIELADLINSEMISFNEIIMNEVKVIGSIPVCTEKPSIFSQFAFSSIVGINQGIFALLLCFRYLLIFIQSMFLTLAKAAGPLLIALYMIPQTQQAAVKYFMISFALSLWGVAFTIADYLTLKVWGLLIPYLMVTILPTETTSGINGSFMTISDLIGELGGSQAIEAFSVSQYLLFLTLVVVAGFILLILSLILNLVGIKMIHAFLSGGSVSGAIRSGIGMVMRPTSAGGRISAETMSRANQSVASSGPAVKNVAMGAAALTTGAVVGAGKMAVTGVGKALTAMDDSPLQTASVSTPQPNLQDGSAQGTVLSPHSSNSTAPSPEQNTSYNKT